MSVKKRARGVTCQLTPQFYLSFFTCQKTLLCGVPPHHAAAQYTHRMEGGRLRCGPVITSLTIFFILR